MSKFEIVAHRGVPNEFPENTIPSFEHAIKLGANAVELDVRLTKDKIPVVYHYCYLHMITSLTGPIFEYTYDQLQTAKYIGKDCQRSNNYSIPTFVEVLDSIGGRTGLEIEIKGPESEVTNIVGLLLNERKHLWESIEVTSFEPMLLRDIKEHCPTISTDLLFPRSESWMDLDVVTYLATHRAKLAGARAVHLHPSQLTKDVVRNVRKQGIEIHSWDVNDEEALGIISTLNIPKFCTDKLQQAIDFRNKISM